MPENRFLQAALVYEERGWCVIPCKPGTKVPAVDWKKYQEKRSTKKQIEKWWTIDPQANVAIVTGKISGITLIDIDGSKGIESLTTLPEPLPDTRRHTTPHGTHHLYQYQSLLYTGANFLPGIDVRNDGGIAVMPPSVVDGEEYRVEANSNIFASFDLPPDILYTRRTDIPSNTDEKFSTTDLWVAKSIRDGAEEGERNSKATSLAGYLFSKGHPSDVIQESLYNFAAKCTPPMDTSDIDIIVNSVGKYHDIEPIKTPGGLLYEWPENGIKLHVDNLRRSTDGCKCLIRVLYADDTPVLSPSSLDLLSVSNRGSIIRALNDRVPLDWNTVIERIATRTISKLSEDESMVDLHDYIDTPIPKWLLDPYVLGDGATILFGQGGLGKSLFVLALMITLQTDHEIVGHTKKEKNHTGLYLDWEDSADTQGERFSMLLRGVGLDPRKYHMFYRACSSPLHDSITSIKRDIDKAGASYVVIDSAALACGGAPDSSDSALNFFNALKGLNVPSVIIAHQTKDMVKPYPFGSIFWHNSARCTWEIRSKGEPSDNKLPIQLFNRKSNRGTRRGRIGYQVDFGTDTIKITKMSYKETVAAFGSQDASVPERIYAELDNAGKLTINSLATRLQLPTDDIRVNLNRNDKFVKLDEGVGRENLWALRQRR